MTILLQLVGSPGVCAVMPASPADTDHLLLSPLQLQSDAVLILYNFSGQCSGEALITFPSEEMAKQAVAERSNHTFYGQQVHLVFCNWAPAL